MVRDEGARLTASAGAEVMKSRVSEGCGFSAAKIGVGVAIGFLATGAGVSRGDGVG